MNIGREYEVDPSFSRNNKIKFLSRLVGQYYYYRDLNTKLI